MTQLKACAPWSHLTPDEQLAIAKHAETHGITATAQHFTRSHQAVRRACAMTAIKPATNCQNRTLPQRIRSARTMLRLLHVTPQQLIEAEE